MSTVTDYRAIYQPYQSLDRTAFCPVCNELQDEYDRERTDRYGYQHSIAECDFCGLEWFYYRMSAERYADFYQSGAYRRLVSAYHGREMGGCDAEYAKAVLDFIGEAKTDADIGDEVVLDIGGAPDGIFKKWDVHKSRSTIIDPAIDGQTAETFDPAGRQWDLITVCQTVDHLLEPGAVFKKLAGCLAPNGVLFFDAVDFDATKEYKIDHPCNFNARSAVMLAHVAGLRIDKMERSGNHLRFLCRHW